MAVRLCVSKIRLSDWILFNIKHHIFKSFPNSRSMKTNVYVRGILCQHMEYGLFKCIFP